MARASGAQWVACKHSILRLNLDNDVLLGLHDGLRLALRRLLLLLQQYLPGSPEFLLELCHPLQPFLLLKLLQPLELLLLRPLPRSVSSPSLLLRTQAVRVC